MTAYTITVTDRGDVAAVANGGTATITVTVGSAAAAGSGAVDSVNGHTGVVVLAASDVGADASGAAAAAQAASQPLDSDLTAIAALTTTTFGRALLALVDAPALRTAAGLGDIATHAVSEFDAAGAAAAAQAASQPLDSDLTAIAALATTTFGRSLLTAADAAAARALTGAGTSSLVIGTTSTTAKAGDYQPAASNISDASTIGRTILTAASAAAVRTAIGLATVAATGAYSDLSGLPTLGTAAAKDIPATGDASATQVVYGSDSRLTNSRTPTAHASTHASAGSDPVTIAESQVTGLTADLAAKVPTTRTVAGHALSADVTITAADVSAVPTTRTVNGHALSADVTVTAADVSAVPTTRTVAGHALSADVTLTDSDISPVTTNDQTGTTYTFVLADGARLVRVSNASAITVTIPLNATVAFPIGTTLSWAQQGAGQITIAITATGTLRTPHGAKTSAQYVIATATKVATDEWYVAGDVTT